MGSTFNYAYYIKFFGEQPDELVRNIINNMKSLSLNIPLIKLKVIRPLVFGSRYNPRVIGLLAESNNYVSELKSITDTIALNYEIEIEKREFVPHITLGRVKQVNNLKLYETYKNMSYQHISLVINKFQFLKSELTPRWSYFYSVLWESLFDSNTDN